jgi:hypothetical protein
MNPKGFSADLPLMNTPPPSNLCTSKPDCRCEFCTVTRFQPTEEDVLALEFIAKLKSKG